MSNNKIVLKPDKQLWYLDVVFHCVEIDDIVMNNKINIIILSWFWILFMIKQVSKHFNENLVWQFLDAAF